MKILRSRLKMMRNRMGYIFSFHKHKKLRYGDTEILVKVGSAWEYSRATGGFETYPLDCFFRLGISPEQDVYYEISSCNSIASLIMSKILTSDRIAVVSFEPEASNVYSSWINMRLNSVRNMVVLPVALSNTSGVLSLHLGGRSIAPGQGGHSIEKDYGMGTTLVPSLTLDKAIEIFNLPRPTLVSIDVEGHEDAVLEGMSGLLSSKCVRCLVVEVWSSKANMSQIEGLMAGYGYTLSDFKTVGDGGCCVSPRGNND